MITDALFPTLIKTDRVYVKNLEMSKYCLDIMKKYPSLDNDWRCSTYNTLNTDYNALEDEYFASLFETIAISVRHHADEHYAIDGDLQLMDAWINIAKPGQYQECHNHTNRHFSAVFYVKAQRDCGDIVFRSPESYFDMFPIPTLEHNTANMKTMSYNAKQNEFLVFRSNLQHLVEENKSNEDRISIALNFNVI